MNPYTKNILGIVTFPVRKLFGLFGIDDLDSLPSFLIWVFRIALILLPAVLFVRHFSYVAQAFATSFGGDYHGLLIIAPFGESVEFVTAWANGGIHGFWDWLLRLSLSGLQAFAIDAFAISCYKVFVREESELTPYGFLNRVIVMVLTIVFSMGFGPLLSRFPLEEAVAFLGKSTPDFWQYFLIVALFVFVAGLFLHSLTDLFLQLGSLILIGLLLNLITNDNQTVILILMYYWLVGSYVQCLQYETGADEDELHGFLKVIYWIITLIPTLIGRLLGKISGLWFGDV